MTERFGADAMRARFHENRAEAAAIRAKSAPAIEERDAVQAKIHALEAELKPLQDLVREIEAPLFELDMEAGRLARALGGRTGAAPE